MDGNRTRVCLLKGGRTDLCATTAYIPQYSPDDEVPTPTARNHTLKKGRTPSNCRSSPLMTPIHYHNIRNIVNTITQHFLCNASECRRRHLLLRNPTTLVSNHKRGTVRYGEPHGVWTDHGDIWSGNEIGRYGEVQAAVWLLGGVFQFQNRAGPPLMPCLSI